MINIPIFFRLRKLSLTVTHQKSHSEQSRSRDSTLGMNRDATCKVVVLAVIVVITEQRKFS